MNIRMFYPILNILSCIILLFVGWGFTRSNVTITENFIEYTIHPVGIFAWLVLIVFVFMLLFIVQRHNKQNPDKKIKAFSIKPPEYNEDDEMYQYATMSATKKVYTFLTWALPMILALLLLPIPFSKFSIFVIVVCIIIVQNLIFYFEMKKFKE
ncbi:hypothetical protein [Ureibacillus chungkukjangi]|uniref:Uncharacterized protein n=1 Tax=Ureibacillus chungkukjangi TaxID=1202712 RepID=A0A318TJJ9_9BACL|nr:hypothetical protein [Ureibacillus chungkukjangi]PYF03980.1 hypothetical protein BJ095_1268 [Ureibacillus chungkukjangi]